MRDIISGNRYREIHCRAKESPSRILTVRRLLRSNRRGGTMEVNFEESDCKRTTLPHQMPMDNTNEISGLHGNQAELTKKLFEACKNGETEKVRMLIQNGAQMALDWLGTSPLHFAAQYGHKDVAEVLLRAGVGKDAKTKVDRTPLHISAQVGSLEVVSLLLMHGADYDARDMLKMTPLHWAVERGHTDVVECLLSNGSDVTLVSKFDKSPIDIALDTGRLDMVPVLQKYVNVARPKPQQPLPVMNKTKPTVLPNKSPRTSKSIKHQQTTNSFKGTYLPQNLQKTINGIDGIRRLLTESNNDASDTSNVFTTLSALAEAANLSSPISNDAINWLETHALTSASAVNDDSPFDSTLDSGTSISLTEAGKLTLKRLQEQTQSGKTSNSKNSNVITIVADSNLPQIIRSAQGIPIVLNPTEASLSQSRSKKVVKITNSTNASNHSNSISRSQSVNTNSKDINQLKQEFEKEKEKLNNEITFLKRQLEEYKQQIIEKQMEIDKYKRNSDVKVKEKL